MTNVALLCATHDPSGKNINLITELAPTLNTIYTKLFITVSEETNKELVNILEENSFNIRVIPKNGAAQARREVIKFGLEHKEQYFHYCDFDRLLTWSNRYAYELRKMVSEIPKHDYLIFGRTERAFNTHPIQWIETEKITNRIFSLELGKEADVTAGSCGFSRKSTELISLYSKDKMTDAEWPMIVKRIGKLEVSYKSVEGLEYQEDINGYSRQVNAAEEWFGRVRLCYIISESAINAGKEFME
ncbi:hypothetical protein [Desnuesiella massiliensis]|uniref:hypothetical protein n=1 Tax=Desnuesiella massiliensis TaxID=1650662 RepID=UPI0006E20794|nr:hypothetical protein [Desnuesiella massiliensis]